MKKAIIFDIDGVLAEKSPDRSFIEYNKVDLDKPIQQGFCVLYNYIRSFNGWVNYNIYKEVIFITGRKELCRQKTIKFISDNINKFSQTLYDTSDECTWLNCYEIEKQINKFLKFNLFMRGDTDHRKAEVLKKEIYDNHIKGKYDVQAVYEDDPDVCRMWKKEGLFVFQVLR